MDSFSEQLKFFYAHMNFLTKDKEAKDPSKLSDEELLEEVKKLPEFEKLVFPNSWYSKFELPNKSCANMKEYIKESPWQKTAQNYYISHTTIPAKPGGNRPVLPAPEVPTITLLENNFSDKPTDQTESSNPPEIHVS